MMPVVFAVADYIDDVSADINFSAGVLIVPKNDVIMADICY